MLQPFGMQGRISSYVNEIVLWVQRSRTSYILLSVYVFSFLFGAIKLLRQMLATQEVVNCLRPLELSPFLANSLVSSAEILGVTIISAYCSFGLQCPATISWPTPILILPEDIHSLPESDAAALICHELAHIRRRDFEVNLALEMFTLFGFYHPALHWMKRRVTESREVVCDEIAANTVGGPTAYARALLGLAEVICADTADRNLMLGALKKTTLEKRILWLVDEARPLTWLHKAGSATCSLTVLLALFVGVWTLSIQVSAAEAAAGVGPKGQMQSPGDLAVQQTSSSPLQTDQTAAKRIGGDVLPPQLISSVEPEVSDEDRAAKIKGDVLVELVVDRQGMPTNVHIIHGLARGLDQEVVVAVSQYRFKPALENGRPVSVDLRISVNFQIS